MARKTKYGSEERGAELEELLDTLDNLLERTKILYEQYFMGIQKIPPAQLHKDIERKIRDLTQEQIRNTALRFRLTTITQKFGSYNTYWKRTLQSIEQGRYTRDIARARRKAQRQGEDIPDELLNSMPKAMRDRIRRDRAKVAEVAERNEHDDEAMIFNTVPGEPDTEDWDFQHLLDGLDADAARPAPVKNQVYQLDEDDDMIGDRIDELFAAITDEPPKPAPKPAPRPAPAPPPARTAPPPAAIERTPVPQPVARPQPAAIERTPVPQPVARPQPAAIERTPVPQPAQAAQPAARPPVPGVPGAVPAVPGAPGRPAVPPRAVPDIAARPAAPSPARPATPAPAARPAAGAIPPPPGMTEAETRSLYEQYRQARQLVGGEDISYDRLKQKLNEQAPRIMQQYKAKGLQYDVVVKDDKVVLKASPKRGE